MVSIVKITLVFFAILVNVLARKNKTSTALPHPKSNTTNLHEIKPPIYMKPPKAATIEKRASSSCTAEGGAQMLPFKSLIQGGIGYLGGQHVQCIYKNWILFPCVGFASPDTSNIFMLQSNANAAMWQQYAVSPDHGWVEYWSTGTYLTIAQLFQVTLTYLIYQNDGNVVLYSGSRGAIWSTGTYGVDSNWLCIQDDANLVLYDLNGNPVWSSNTGGYVATGF
ncbi:hypothetical protein HK098_008141 [Nowakowskiella sp. JEL0407]|nr:hypothetical protein HK098_008141 [Nowakowskiella sp. JEL0407]